MKKILFYLIISSAYISAYAQYLPSPTFLWEKTSNLGMANSIEYADNAIFIVGNDHQSTPPNGLLFQKMDTSGALLWNKPQTIANGTLTGDDLLVLPNGEMIVAGTHYDQATQKDWDYIGFFDANGDLNYQQTYYHDRSQPYIANARRIISHSQGRYIFGGNHLFMVDSLGTEVWSKQATISDLTNTSDGGFVAVGSKHIGGGAASWYIWKFDANGDSLWYHELNGIGTIANSVAAVLEDPISQGILVLGSAYNSITGTADIFIQKFSASGSFISHQFILRHNDDHVLHAAWGGLQEIMVTTYAEDSLTGELVSLMGLNTNGTIYYDHVRGNRQVDSYRHAVSDGQYIYMVGTMVGFALQVLYKKLDISGVLVIGIPVEPEEITYFPNPVQAVLHIKPNDDLTPEWKLWDPQGRLIKSGIFPIGKGTDWNIPMDDLQPGTYWLEYSLNQGEPRAVSIVLTR